MRKPTRSRYLNSEAWQRTRKCHLLTYPECRACGTTEDVVVHHLRYRGKLGVAERPGDLMTLCRTHHTDFHKTFGKRDLIANTLRYVEQVRLLEAV